MARARPKLRGVADDDQPEVYSPAWVKMIHRQAKQELRQRQQVASFKPLPASGYAVQDINLFPDDDWIAINMSTAAGTVMDRSQASALSSGLNRLLDHSCHHCP